MEFKYEYFFLISLEIKFWQCKIYSWITEVCVHTLFFERMLNHLQVLWIGASVHNMWPYRILNTVITTKLWKITCVWRWRDSWALNYWKIANQHPSGCCFNIQNTNNKIIFLFFSNWIILFWVKKNSWLLHIQVQRTMLSINGETQFITYRSALNLISVLQELLT